MDLPYSPQHVSQRDLGSVKHLRLANRNPVVQGHARIRFSIRQIAVTSEYPKIKLVSHQLDQIGNRGHRATRFIAGHVPVGEYQNSRLHVCDAIGVLCLPYTYLFPAFWIPVTGAGGCASRKPSAEYFVAAKGGALISSTTSRMNCAAFLACASQVLLRAMYFWAVRPKFVLTCGSWAAT